MMMSRASCGEELLCRGRNAHAMPKPRKHRRCNHHGNCGRLCGDNVVDNLALRPGLMLPDKKDFFQYFGSQVTPPCSEVVNWIVMKEPILITKAQLEGLHALQSRWGNLISETGNLRPIQPLNGRNVLANSC